MYYYQVSEFKTEQELIMWESATNLNKPLKKAGFISHQEPDPTKSTKKGAKTRKSRRSSKEMKTPLPDPSAAMRCPKASRTGLNCKMLGEKGNPMMSSFSYWLLLFFSSLQDQGIACTIVA